VAHLRALVTGVQQSTKPSQKWKVIAYRFANAIVECNVSISALTADENINLEVINLLQGTIKSLS